MYEKTYPSKRYKETLNFLERVAPPPAKVLDLGSENPLSQIMRQQGYQVNNTQGEDLDLELAAVRNPSVDLVTAFEIFEHLVSPFNVLREIQCDKLVASVPLRLWFSPAYRSKTDPWDRHFHEFEDWQFDWLITKAGWEIRERQKWTNPVKKVGIRPLMRLVTPRYYIVYAERKRS